MSEHLQLQFLHEVDKLTSKKYAETINRLFAGNKLFVTCQTKRGLTPPTTLAYALGRQWFLIKRTVAEHDLEHA